MKIIKRVVCTLLCLCTVAMCSCSSGGYIATLEIDGTEIQTFDSQFTDFWVSYQKRAYSSVAEQYEDGWEHIVDPQTGMTVYDLLMSQVKVSIKNFTAIQYLHDEKYKLELSKEQKDSIDKLVSDIMAAENANNEIEKCGADENSLKLFYELMMKQSNVYNHIYKDSKEFKISESQKQDYFKDNYAIAEHIFFEFEKLDEDGNLLSEEQFRILENKTIASAVEVYEAIEAGADFDEMKAQHDSDLEGQKLYPKGFFVTNDSSFPAEFTAKVMELQEGSVDLVKTPNVGMHIIRKLPMDSKLYNEYESVEASIENVFFANDFTERVSEVASKVEIDNDEFDEIDPEQIPLFPYSLM